MLALQCVRRFYETHYVQVFSSTSKINITHYIVGHLHYIGALLSIFCYAEGFVQVTAGQQSSMSINHLNNLQIIGIAIFLYSWYHQYQSNLILSNLRRNTTGKNYHLQYAILNN